MKFVFAPYIRQFVLVFMDDILVYNKCLLEHENHLKVVLQILREHKLYANMNKCSFAQQSLNYLGHIISGQGLAPDQEKTKNMTD